MSRKEYDPDAKIINTHSIYFDELVKSMTDPIDKALDEWQAVYDTLPDLDLEYGMGYYNYKRWRKENAVT